MIEFGNHHHGVILSQRMKSVYSPASEIVISRSEKGNLYGGCIYEGYTGTAIGIHICGMRPNWINRDLIYFCFAYPFNQLKVNMLLGKVASTNLEALNIDLHLGFKVVATIEGAVPGGNLLIVRMDREDCHWLHPRYRPRNLEIHNGSVVHREEQVCIGSIH